MFSRRVESGWFNVQSGGSMFSRRVESGGSMFSRRVESGGSVFSRRVQSGWFCVQSVWFLVFLPGHWRRT